MIELIILLIGLAALIIASYTDIRTREVPDYLSAAVIVAAIGLRFLHSFFNNDWWFFFHGLISFGIFIAIAMILFYSGQWGGGDAKLLMALGAIFATYPALLLNYFNPVLNFYFPIILLLNILVIGAIYSLIYGLALAGLNYKDFMHDFKKIRDNKKIKHLRYGTIILSVVLIIAAVFVPDFILKLVFVTCAFVVFLAMHLWLFAKTIESCCMIKKTPVSKLTEGDWVAEDVYYRKKKICSPKDLGLDMAQIKLMKKYKIKNILVKKGVPFVPGMLAAVIFTLIFGNLFLAFL